MQLKNHNYLYKQNKLKFARKPLSFLPCCISKWQALLTQSFLQIPKFKKGILKKPFLSQGHTQTYTAYQVGWSLYTHCRPQPLGGDSSLKKQYVVTLLTTRTEDRQGTTHRFHRCLLTKNSCPESNVPLSPLSSS